MSNQMISLCKKQERHQVSLWIETSQKNNSIPYKNSSKLKMQEKQQQKNKCNKNIHTLKLSK